MYKQNTESPEVGVTEEGWRSPLGGTFSQDLERWQEAKMAGDRRVGTGVVKGIPG